MTVLTVNAVSKIYKGMLALHPSSFEVTTGTSVVLCGGNGAGKSTLLQIIAGVLSPTNGSTSIDGITLRDGRKEYLTKIGFMPDDFNAQEMMTVNEFLSFYGTLRKVKKVRVNEVLNIIGLQEKSHELVKSLSKGMRQRLLLGQAILANPAVLLLDEPTNGLDPYWVNQFIEILHQIKKTGTIVIFSTHMMDVAAETGDIILFMRQGEIIEKISNEANLEETTKLLMRLHRQ